MWSTENIQFCGKYIEKQPKTSQNSLFSAVFLVEVTGLEPAISSSRTMRDTTFATPRCGKNIRFFVSGQTCGQTEDLMIFRHSGEPKKSVFVGGSALLENSTPSVVIETRTKHSTKLSHTPITYFAFTIS